MENKKEMTIPNVSAATDAEQSLSKCTDNSIVNQDTDFNADWCGITVHSLYSAYDSCPTPQSSGQAPF